MFIIDFDDTLFDTERFKQARLNAVKKLGVPEDVYWHTYTTAIQNATGNMYYGDRQHAEAMAEHGFDADALEKNLVETSNPDAMPGWLFPDAMQFLQALKDAGARTLLLSHGTSAFQTTKIHHSGVLPYFDDVTIISGSKVPWVKAMTGQTKDTVWFINDKVAETQEVAGAVPGAVALLKVASRFPHRDYETSGLPYFHTLAEILEYVREQEK